MKSTFTAALVCAAFSQVDASLMDNLTNYALEGLATHNKIKSERHVDKKPKLQAYGWSSDNDAADGDWGWNAGLNADVGLSYESPLYNQDQYLINRLRANLYAGGRNYFILYLGPIKVQFFLDVWGAKLTFFDNYIRYDIVNYGDFCNAAQWYLEIARL